jgi:chromosomal replication initiation ATPase DnaA
LVEEEVAVEEEPQGPTEEELLRLEAQQRQARINELCASLEALQFYDGRGAAIKIARAVAKAHCIEWKDFISRQRWQHITRARFHAMWEIRNATTLSLSQIGHIFRFDHTSIMWGIKQHQKRLDSGEFPSLSATGGG